MSNPKRTRVEVRDAIKKTKVSKKQYIGLVHDESNDNFTIGYNISTNINRMLKWKEEMLECCNVEDCKVFEIKEINQNKDESN